MTTATPTPCLEENRERGSHSLQRLVGRHSTATLYKGDCLEILPQVETVAAIVTDPPYGISIKTGFNGDDKSCQFDDGFSVMFFLDRHIEMWDAAVKPSGAVYIFTRFDVMPYWWLRLKGHFDIGLISGQVFSGWDLLATTGGPR